VNHPKGSITFDEEKKEELGGFSALFIGVRYT